MTPYDLITTVNTASASYSLTDLTTAKTELEITDTSDDAWLLQAIGQVSASIANYCQRVFPVEALTDTFYVNRHWRWHQRTDDRDVLQLTRYPIQGVQSVVETYSDGSTSTLVLGTDYIRNDRNGQLIRLNSDTGFPGHWVGSKIVVQYQAGYGTLAAQAATVPATPFQVTVTNANLFSIDQGVVYTSTGVALVAVAANPTVGQYAVNPATGIYTFAAADTAQNVTISYFYRATPFDVVDATLRLLTARYRAEARDPMLMERSQSGAPGSERYWVGTMPGQNGAFAPEIASLLDNYRVPVVA